jgi:hypothetical protein
MGHLCLLQGSVEYYRGSEVIPRPEMASLLAAWCQIYVRSYLQLSNGVVIIFALVQTDGLNEVGYLLLHIYFKKLLNQKFYSNPSTELSNI